MGKKSGPPPPDYTAAAEKTAASNKDAVTAQTWANRPTQVDPWGRVDWSSQQTIDPATGQPVTQWTQNTTLDPRLQSALDSQIDVQQRQSALAQSLLGREAQEYSQPMDWGSLGAWGTGPQQQALTPTTYAYGGGPQQLTHDTGLASTPTLQTSLDYSGAQAVQGSDQSRQRAEDAIYQSATSRLDPQWQQRQTDLETQLAQSGISRNSEAYTRAMADFNRQRSDAYQQASMGAITGGGAEAQRNQGMDLALRQQQVGEAGTQGQFYNQALTGQFGLGQQATQQQLAQQAQAFQQQLQGLGYGMQQQQQAFGQQQAAGQQAFSQQLQGAQYANQLRQAQLAEAMQQRGFSLNEIQALLNGQQVSMPQFQGFNQAGNYGGTNYTGAAQDQYAAAMQQQANQNAATGQLIGGAATIAGSALGGPLGGALGGSLFGTGGIGGGSAGKSLFSDRATKVLLQRIARDARGFHWWIYRCVGETLPRVGVIAQEVRRVMPEAVSNVRGVLRVDYGLIAQGS